ncbi:hypothetical protein AAHE18_U035100 [Arachis hypogaea]
MSATMISDPMVIAAPAETQSAASIVSEVEFAICDCCGLREECTIGYIERIRERLPRKMGLRFVWRSREGRDCEV